MTTGEASFAVPRDIFGIMGYGYSRYVVLPDTYQIREIFSLSIHHRRDCQRDERAHPRAKI